MEGEGGWFPRRRSCQAGGEAPDAGSSPRAKAKQVSGGDESCQPASARRIRSDQRLTEVPAPLWAGPGWWDTHAFVGEPPPPSQLHTPRQLHTLLTDPHTPAAPTIAFIMLSPNLDAGSLWTGGTRPQTGD